MVRRAANPAALLEFSPRNPSRPVDWRWRLSGHLVAAGEKASRKRHDRDVRRCWRFRHALDGCSTEADYLALAASHPNLYWAHQLYADRDGQGAGRLHAYGIEARLLADQPAAEIADRSGVEAAIIEDYHACFFEVRPRRQQKDFLMFQVLGDAVYRGLRERNYDALWKLFAIWGGPKVVDALISTFDNPTRPVEAEGVDGFIRAAVRSKLALKALYTAQMVEIDKFTAPQLLERYLQQVELEKKGGEAARPMIVTGLGEILEAMSFGVAGKSHEALGRTPIAPDLRALAEPKAIEYSGAELVRMAAGETIDIEDRPLPPPPRRAGGPADAN